MLKADFYLIPLLKTPPLSLNCLSLLISRRRNETTGEESTGEWSVEMEASEGGGRGGFVFLETRFSEL